MAKRLRCPNCTRNIVGHEPNGCVLEALMSVLRDRGGHTDKQMRKLWANVDVDALWNAIGPIVDDLGEGVFTS